MEINLCWILLLAPPSPLSLIPSVNPTKNITNVPLPPLTSSSSSIFGYKTLQKSTKKQQSGWQEDGSIVDCVKNKTFQGVKQRTSLPLMIRSILFWIFFPWVAWSAWCQSPAVSPANSAGVTKMNMDANPWCHVMIKFPWGASISPACASQSLYCPYVTLSVQLLLLLLKHYCSET